MGASEDGIQGNGTLEYRVDWGDGAVSDWSREPFFEHRYGQPADFAARAFARNGAGQTASHAILFHVGQDPSLNWFQQRFSSANQESTFFILGLGITAIAALSGIGLTRARRGFVRRHVQQIEHMDEPAALRRLGDALEARFADGKLDEMPLDFLVRRIEDRLRRLRLGTVRRELRFLPVSIMDVIEDILRDGEVDRIERDRVVALIDEAPLLSGPQKAEARRLVHGWAAQDA